MMEQRLNLGAYYRVLAAPGVEQWALTCPIPQKHQSAVRRIPDHRCKLAVQGRKTVASFAQIQRQDCFDI